MKRYAQIQDGRLFEIIEPFVKQEKDRPAAPVPVENEAELSVDERDERARQQAEHDSYVPGEVPIEERFTPDVVATMVPVPEGQDVQPGMLYDGAVFSAAPAAPTVDPAESVRLERQRLLNISDWTQLADVPAETQEKWRKYRQALRDVPEQSGFPDNVKWPKEPT